MHRNITEVINEGQLSVPFPLSRGSSHSLVMLIVNGTKTRHCHFYTVYVYCYAFGNFGISELHHCRDFSKVFDSVCHFKLLHKPEGYGIGGKLLCWIRDYLSHRTQAVKVENNKSLH